MKQFLFNFLTHHIEHFDLNITKCRNHIVQVNKIQSGIRIGLNLDKLIIKIYDSGKSKPDQMITIPISKIRIGEQLLPDKAKTILGREGIDINKLSELANKKISKGSLIEIETGKEKITISVDSE